MTGSTPNHKNTNREKENHINLFVFFKSAFQLWPYREVGVPHPDHNPIPQFWSVHLSSGQVFVISKVTAKHPGFL